MLTQLIYMLAIGSALTEIAFVKGSKRFAKVMHNGFNIWIPFKGKLHMPAIWCNLIFSTALSLQLGHWFGAVGLVAMMGGILSTGITAAYYTQMETIDALWARREELFSRIQRVALVTWKSVVLVWSIFTAPVRLAIWVTTKAKAGWRSVVAFYYALPFTNRKATAS